MNNSASSVSDLLHFLSNTQIFQGLESTDLENLAQLCCKRTYTKGDSLFFQGERADGFLIVYSGRIKVYKLSSNGREQILHIFGEGDHFAEVPAFDGDCFPASASALEQTEVFFFPRQLFLTLLEQNPNLAINLVKSFARHLRRFSHLVDNLSLREVPGRLATYLLALSQKSNNADNIKLDISKGQLAALLGTIPETLSRAFYKLDRDGIIAINGASIDLCDRTALEALTK